jgi:hypothetical protein
MATPGPDDRLIGFRVSTPQGEYVFREGDASVGMYVIEKGSIELLKARGTSERRSALLEQGDFFGEMSLLESGKRDCSARAATAAELLLIDAPTFDRIVREFPEIPIRMLYKLARRLREKDREAAEASDAAAREAAREPAAGTTRMAAAAPRPMKLVLRHAASGTLFALPPVGELTVGRADRKTGQTPEIDLTVLDSSRSTGRRHARIVCRDGGCFLHEEVVTQNGTFVNGTRLAAGQEVRLADGDRLRFGLVELDCRQDPAGR